jgi:hypothetical protein
MSEVWRSGALKSRANLIVRFQVLTAASMKFRVFWDVALKWTDVSEVRIGSIIVVMYLLVLEAVRTSETSVNFNVNTRCYIP